MILAPRLHERARALTRANLPSDMGLWPQLRGPTSPSPKAPGAPKAAATVPICRRKAPMHSAKMLPILKSGRRQAIQMPACCQGHCQVALKARARITPHGSESRAVAVSRRGSRRRGGVVLTSPRGTSGASTCDRLNLSNTRRPQRQQDPAMIRRRLRRLAPPAAGAPARALNGTYRHDRSCPASSPPSSRHDASFGLEAVAEQHTRRM